MGYLTVLYVGFGAKIGDLHAKDSNSFRNKLIGKSVVPPNFSSGSIGDHGQLFRDHAQLWPERGVFSKVGSKLGEGPSLGLAPYCFI